MKTGRRIRLVLSHLALIAIGWAIGSAFVSTATPDPWKTVSPDPPPPRDTTRREANPILRARAADFRAAWKEIIQIDRSQSGEPGGNSINFFVDWCAVDPEGAVLGLSKLYAPRFGHNYLSNAVGEHGAGLAPALVKHWRELVFQQSYKVSSVMGKSLQKLAVEDPAHAAALVTQLPQSIRSDVYGNLFEDLTRPNLEALIEALIEGLPRGEEFHDDERLVLWQAFGKSLERCEPDTGVADWLAKTDDPQARRALVEVATQKSMRNENWDNVLTTIETFDATKQSAIIDDVLILARSDPAGGKHRARLLKSCEARGLDALAEQIRNRPDR